MERRLDQELTRIRQHLLSMGGLVEEMVDHAIRALVERDDSLSQRVIEQDAEVDRLEMDIDGECNTVMVRHQPAAGDLRYLVAVMKIINELERMGDSAVNMCESIKQLNQQAPLKPYIDLPRMADKTREMVRDSLDAFVARDSEAAQQVIVSDDVVDGIYEQIFRELLTFMIEDPKTVSRSLHLLLIAHNLERIADHATNVAEDVIYYVEGRDVRHPLSRRSDAEPISERSES